MQVNGYSLIRESDGAELYWWEAIPERFEIPDASIVVFSADQTWAIDGYHIEARTREFTDPPVVDPNLPAPVVPISRRQMLLELMSAGIITQAEAISAAQTGAVPSVVQQAFDTLPTEQQAPAAITWATMSEVDRSHPLISLLQGSLGLTDQQVDDMFRAALLL